MRHPLRIGLSARLLHAPPAELGFRGKTLQYIEQSVAHWVLRHGAMSMMLPTLGHDAEVARRKVSVRCYAEALDGLILQGGADLSPSSYGQRPLRPEWTGDAVRDRYEIELIEGFLAAGKPVLGICRGCQLLNVAFGGTLLQDIGLQRPQARAHVDPIGYDQHLHTVRLEPDAPLAALYPAQREGVINSIHHQAIDRLGGDLLIEAHSADDGIVEAIRARSLPHVRGVQWHPEFTIDHPQALDPAPLLDDFLQACAWARAGQAQRPLEDPP